MCLFGPKRVVYVSCNVHTQARDVGILVQGFDRGVGGEPGEDGHKAKAGAEQETDKVGEQSKKGPYRYEIERLGGFDFFPQTGHVEGVCILNRVEE